MGIRPGCVIGLQADYSLAAAALLFAALARGCIVAMIPRDRNVATYLNDACAEQISGSTAQGSCAGSASPARAITACSPTCAARGKAGSSFLHPALQGCRRRRCNPRSVFSRSSPSRAARSELSASCCSITSPGSIRCFTRSRAGGTLILTQQRDPASVSALIESHAWRCCRCHRASCACCACRPRHQEWDLSSLKIITYGSEPMDAPTLALLNQRFPDVQIIQKYGTTETGSPQQRFLAGTRASG